MKKLVKTILVGLIVISANSFGQTADNKNNISIGGGKQSYNGDLGNSWFKMDEEWYGFVSLHYNRYLTKSFDFSASFTHGDYGKCRDHEDDIYRPDGTLVLNMLSRLTTGIISMKYKFANGYLLKENAKLSPYIYLGGGINNISNRWWDDKTRVNPGNFTSVNGGIGLRYNFYKNFSFTYNLGIGVFTSDNLDFRSSNDKYLQHNFMLGINF